MQLFANETETRFFVTDQYLKNLHLVTIETIKDFVYKYSLDSLILLDASELCIVDWDEVKSGNRKISFSCDEPEIIGDAVQANGEWDDMEYLDILHEITKYIQVDYDYLSDLVRNGSAFSYEEYEDKEYEQDFSVYIVSHLHDKNRVLLIRENYMDSSQVSYLVDKNKVKDFIENQI